MVTARRFAVCLLLGLLAGLTPLAYATPTDQTWLSGLYDNADYDDVVLALTSTAGVSDGVAAAPIGLALEAVDVVAVPGAPQAADALRVPYRLRAPPLA